MTVFYSEDGRDARAFAAVWVPKNQHSRECLRQGLLGIQNPPKRSCKDIFLGCRRNAAFGQHPPVAFQRAVEFAKIAVEDIRPVDNLFKRADSTLRRMRAHDSRPPEQRLEKLVVLLLLDQR